ncbi:protease inhibitor I42 family protein [Methylobacterium oryzisoli]|uniref:protease inhibitor I42 family protein n=1 Tax=Methylobacterium oryzisoli TaxID=3385502 RepID=UPI003891C5F5
MSTSTKHGVAKVGDDGTVALSAPADGVGGFRWQLELPPEVGTLVSREQSPGGAVGAGSETTFIVKVNDPDGGPVQLVKKRPWEQQPVEVLRYTISRD